MSASGLRERKKQATRAMLIEAARRLAAEHGAGEVRLEDIAAAAGVSPRTIGNYFAGKQELIAAIGADRAARIAETLSARPAGEPLWDALEHTLLAQFAERSGVTRANVAASVATPALRAARLELDRSVEPVLAWAVAERTGTDPDRDLYPRLVAGAVVSLTRVVIDHWLASEDPELSLPGLLREALRQVSQGLPVPEGQR